MSLLTHLVLCRLVSRQPLQASGGPLSNLSLQNVGLACNPFTNCDLTRDDIRPVYANSLMVTLNARKNVRDADSKAHASFAIPLSRIVFHSSRNSPIEPTTAHKPANADGTEREISAQTLVGKKSDVLGLQLKPEDDVETSSA